MPGRWDRRRGAEVAAPAEVAPRDALTAAAQVLKLGRASLLPSYDSWQREVWAYYDELGEFRYGVDWKAEMISRVRLRAGRVRPGSDEPELADDGPAAERVDRLGGGTVGGRSQLMHDLSVQHDVPGECWLTDERRDGVDEVLVRSTDEIRGRAGSTEVVDLERSLNTRVVWRRLSADALVTRVWRPHARWHHLADSSARTARPIMRELDLVNRRIVSLYLSRLASAGILFMPEEATFPVRPEFQDEDDPMVLEFIETAREAIANPGTAAAVIPMPMRVPAELIEKFRHLLFATGDDDKILEKRESAIRRLATVTDLPAEVLLGMGDVTHWGQWQLEESAIKAHITPTVERICHSLTVGYLRPQLAAAGEDPREWVTWYDASEITIRPDRSANAVQAYDRLELTGAALRRETGFDEADRPEGDDLRDQLLKRVAADPTLAPTVIEELTGEALDAPAPGAPQEGAVPGEGDPETPGDEPPAGDQSGGDRAAPGSGPGKPEPADATRFAGELRDLVTRAEAESRARRAARPHRLERRLDGLAIRHPGTCSLLPVACPYDEALGRLHVIPGRTGVYECWLEANDTRLAVGRLRQDVAGPDAAPDPAEQLVPAGANGARPGA